MHHAAAAMPYRAPTLRVPAVSRSRRWTFGVAAVLAVATLAIVAVRRKHATATAASTPVTRVQRLPWPGAAHAWTVHRTDDGVRQIIYGPLRVSAAADQAITVANVRFEASIIAAVPVATGWVFVTADGAVAASEGFLETPRPIGRFPCAFKVARDSVGRAVAIGEDGSLWSTDGSAALVHSRTPGEVRAATFMDGSHGAAVMRDGRVLLTADAGQSWSRYTLPDDVAWGVAPNEGGVAIETTRGREVFRWEGVGAPGQPGVSRPLRTLAPRDEENRLRSLINGRYERFEPAGNIARCAAATVSAETTTAESQRRYVCRAGRPLRPITLLPLAFQRSVDASDLLSGTESGPVRGRFWRTRPDTTGETFVRVTWMGVDEGGPFHGATSPSGRGLAVHWPLEQRGPLRVEAISRRGVLVSTHDQPTDPVLAWGTPARAFVRVLDPFVGQAPSGMKSFSVALPDGGVLAVFASPLFEAARETWSTRYAERSPQVGAAIALDATGTVLARRGFIGDDPNLMMIARAGEAVGPVVRDHSEPPRWRMLPVDGRDAPALPSLRWENIAACGPQAGTGPTLAVAYPPISLDRPDADREPMVVSRADLEVSDGSLCVRALSLAGRRLTARPGDRFDGPMLCEPAP